MSDDKDNGGNSSGDGGEPFRGAGSRIKELITELKPILLTSALKIQDMDKGRQYLVDLVKTACKSQFGAAMRQLELTIETLKARIAETELERAHVRELLEATPQWVPSSKTNHGRSADEHVETGWRDWQARHKVESALILILLPFAVIASLLTAQANLEGTGLPIFQDGFLVWAMASLAPLSGFAVKTMWSHLHREDFRTVFTLLLNFFAVLSILAWLGLYAANFHGLSSGSVTAGLFDDPTWWDNAKKTGFTIATLLTEILITSVLAHRLDKIAAFYAPNYWLENLECRSLREWLDRVNAEHKRLTAQLIDAEGELAAYSASLEAQIQIALLAYDARRGDRNDPIL